MKCVSYSESQSKTSETQGAPPRQLWGCSVGPLGASGGKGLCQGKGWG